jgi:hypothetical protein
MHFAQKIWDGTEISVKWNFKVFLRFVFALAEITYGCCGNRRPPEATLNRVYVALEGFGVSFSRRSVETAKTEFWGRQHFRRLRHYTELPQVDGNYGVKTTAND